MITKVKMVVTPELSERVQEIVFKNGGGWYDVNSTLINKQVENTEHPYLFIDKNKWLGFAKVDDTAFFKAFDYIKVSPYDFIASQGEQAWLPKYGEKAEFSVYKDEVWIKSTFAYYEPKSNEPFHSDSGIGYAYCRPINQTKQTKIITINGKDIEISEECFKNLKEQLLKD
jgi:hypothetical protein